MFDCLITSFGQDKFWDWNLVPDADLLCFMFEQVESSFPYRSADYLFDLILSDDSLTPNTSFL
jgi:hypothetical protein